MADFWDNAASSAPGPLGSGYRMFKSGMKIDDDGKATAGEVMGVTADAIGFVTSCGTTAASIATDPLGWLIGQGLGFLMNVVTPIKDAIRLVSGNPDALSAAAGKYNEIGKEIDAIGADLVKTLSAELEDWQGEAADAAKERLERFVHGVAGTADRAGDIARLLQISSMVVQVIEEFIKGLLTDLVEWLIVTWLAALAAAPVTFGASTAGAGAATGVQATRTTVKATQKVGKFTQLLNKIKEVIAKIQRFLKESKMGQMFMDTTTGKGGKLLAKAQDNALDKATAAVRGPLTRGQWSGTIEGAGSVGGIATNTVGERIADYASGFPKKLVGLDKTTIPGGDGTSYYDPGKILGKAGKYTDQGQKIADHSGIGEDRSDQEIRGDLDL